MAEKPNSNKIVLKEIKRFFEDNEGWSLKDLINEVSHETGLLRHKDMENHTLSLDECGIEWDGDYVCLLEDFIDAYTSIFFKKVCNVISSFE